LRRPIRIQILLPFSATMVAAVAIIAMTSAWMAVRRTEEQTLLRIQNVVETLSDFRLTYTDAILEKMSGLSGAEFLALDRDDRPVAATLARPEQIAQAAKSAPVISSESSMTQLPRVDTELGACFAARVTTERAGPVTTLLVLYPEASWKEARWTAIWPPLLVGCGTVIVMACISAWLADRISRRINGVRALLEEIAAGRFPDKSDDGPDEGEQLDEIDDLIASAGSLSEQLKELQHAIQHTERVRLLAQLAGGLAHQLRNAVTGARMAVQLHQKRCQLSSDVAIGDSEAKSDDTLNVALHQLSLTEEQIRGLLSLSRQEVEPVQPAKLSDAVREVERLISVQCEHFRVTLLVDIPDGAEWEIADVDGFRTAVLNLSLNALEAAGEGGRVEIVVLPDCETSDDELPPEFVLDDSSYDRAIVVEVRDSGDGPAAEVSDSLFEPFVTSKPEGVGLGLALAMSAAESAGGTLSWERRDGLTVFRFSVPAQRVAAGLERSCREVS
jgi:signal transduction histidine kinase